MGKYHDEQISFNIVLYQPEIPENTGNIGRLCIGTYAHLHLIKPMRFILSDKYLKRAGLDYWDKVKLTLHDDWDSFICLLNKESKLYLCSTKGKRSYTDVKYKTGDYLVFGPESRGLPLELLAKYQSDVLKIPMSEEIRSINLANSVAIVLYEGIRQVQPIYPPLI